MSHLETPLSLYIHIPWCIRKCPYCDFNSHAKTDSLPEIAYIDALINDAKQHQAQVDERPLQSIFIGGGTPSLLSAKAYERLFRSLRNLFLFSPDIEITLEANPGSVEQQRFKAYRDLGINRLSLGIQSFNDTMLKRLGRIHHGQDAIKAIEASYLAGFDNINLDLMHHLPKQTPKEAETDIQTALSFSPTHLSWYQLTIEPNTVFYSRPPKQPNEIIQEEIEEVGKTLLNTYENYEVSAYCLDKKYCKHNLNYWQFGDYIGIGAGAHGKMTHENRIVRTVKKRQPNAYLDDQRATLCTLDEKNILFEFMLNATRLRQAIPCSLFTDRTGLSMEALTPLLEKAKTMSLLEYNTETFKVSTHGKRFLNDLQALFLPTT